ncbi:MAG: LysR family transcriptional regulator [Acutalibacteraceae bacterium]
MELRNLRTLVRIAELGSFSAAAEDLGYTQSTVTMQIKALEEELGAPLFDRIGRRVRLTDSGRQAVQSARVMLAESERLLRSVQSEENALVRVGVYESLCGGFLPGTMQHFGEPARGGAFGGDSTRTELERRLQADQVDLIWVYGHDAPEHTRTLAEFSHPTQPLCAAGSPLAGRQIAPAELLGQKIIYTEPGCPYRRLLERFLEEQELSPEVFLETGSADVVLRFVEAGLGIGFMPKFHFPGKAGGPCGGGLWDRRLRARLYSRIYAHSDKWLTPAMEAFARAALTEAGQA